MKTNILFISIYILFISSCSSFDSNPTSKPPSYSEIKLQEMFEMISEGQQELKDGDLVVRRGRDMISYTIRQFNRTDHFYSHAGIVFYDNKKPYIYHIYPNDKDTGSQFFKDSLRVFADPFKNDGYGIYRYNLDSVELQKLKTNILLVFNNKIRFDMKFDQRTDDEMYCSEMIRKALLQATNNRINIKEDKLTNKEIKFFAKKLNIPESEGDNRKIVAIDNLYLNPNCKFIQRFVYDSSLVR